MKDSHKGLIFFGLIFFVVALVVVAARWGTADDYSPPPRSTRTEPTGTEMCQLWLDGELELTSDAQVQLCTAMILTDEFGFSAPSPAACDLWWDDALELTEAEATICVARILADEYGS